MSILPRWLKAVAKQSDTLVKLNSSLHWKIHLFIDWWGTKVWTRTSEVVTPLGFKLTSGLHPAYQLMRNGQIEVDETAIILRLLSRVDVFVDIGANLGYYTCLALQHGKRVVAFEPQQQNLQCLFQNLKSNGWEQRAEVFPVALSDRPGLLTLYGASGPSASLIKDWAGYSSRFRKTVAVSTLDNLLAGRFGAERLFIKIDVEGAEFQVLRGSLLVLGRMPKPIWLLEICLEEFHPDGKNPDFQEVFTLFWEHGYSAFTATATPERVDPHEVANWTKKGSAESGTFNYIFAESGEVFH